MSRPEPDLDELRRALHRTCIQMGENKCLALVSRKEVDEAGRLHAPSAVIVVGHRSIAVWDSSLHATTGIRVRTSIGSMSANACSQIQWGNYWAQ